MEREAPQRFVCGGRVSRGVGAQEPGLFRAIAGFVSFPSASSVHEPHAGPIAQPAGDSTGRPPPQKDAETPAPRPRRQTPQAAPPPRRLAERPEDARRPQGPHRIRRTGTQARARPLGPAPARPAEVDAVKARGPSQRRIADGMPRRRTGHLSDGPRSAASSSRGAAPRSSATRCTRQADEPNDGRSTSPCRFRHSPRLDGARAGSREVEAGRRRGAPPV